MDDAAVLPPEIISGLLYAGPGASSMIAAAEAWRQVAAETETAAEEYDATLCTLAEEWQGPAVAAMLAAADPYARWLHTTANQANDIAARARAAAAAFQTALGAVVPPALIAENRAELVQLVTTNVFGQNSDAIAATEAIYAQMWAVDASAMNQYQVSSRAATAAIVPFQPPPATTKPHTGPSTPGMVQRPPNHPPLPAVQASSGGPVHTSSAAPAAGSGTANVSTGDGTSTILGMDPTSMASVLVSAAGFSAMAATNATNRPLPLMIGALGATAPPVGLASTAGGAPETVRAAGPVDTPPVLASAADGHVMGGLSVPPTWDARVANLSSARPLTSALGDAGDTPPLALPVGVATPSSNGRPRRRRPYSQPDDFEYGRPTPKILGHNPFGG
ncbi:MAG TPA: PPE domain-containing protein [Mycobacterium sp.]|nr:PPE domain-containing protein [Mycobacterium sp.]